MEVKNTSAIDKIYEELVCKDYMAHYIKWRKKHPKRVDKKGNPIVYPGGYSLSEETREAAKIKKDYINGVISEEEYKAFCLRYNLLTK